MALLNTYQDSEFAVSLRRLFSSYSGPLVRVIRESDFVEVDVLPDSNGEISYDSSLSRPEGTLAYTLGQFLNIDGYTDADSLGSVYEGRLITIYDQSIGANHVSYDTFSNAFLFVEHSLPAIFPNSTGIIKVSGVPSFFAVGTSKTFTPYTLLGTEYSLHFLSGRIGSNPIGFRVQGIDTNGFFTSPYDVLLYTNLATTVFQPSGSTNVFDVNNVYINTEQCTETQNNVFAKPTGQSEDTVINSIEFAFFDNATTQANFSAAVDGPSFYIVANSFYADIIVYEGYDNIRRLFIEDLYSNAVNNVETKIALSTFSFEEENVQDNSFIAQFGTPAAAYSVRSLRGLTGVNGPKILRVRRAVDNIEVDVYTDNSGWVSLDSPIENVYETTINTVNREYISLATTLGEFVADPSYNNPDNITTTTATVSAWYDQSKVNTNLLPLQITNDEAASAYSVRLINPEYNGPLLKVRRSSDNVTKDIYPNANGELDVDDIEQFIQDGVMGPDYTEEYLLDIIPDGETEAPQAAAAYSLRKLKASYTGPLVRVRRTDGKEVDVYPQQDGWFGLESPIENLVESPVEEGDFDGVLTFKYFAQNDNVTIVTWYDQSGSSNDATQDQTSSQPKIYDSVTGVVLKNGEPAVDFDGTSDFLSGSLIISSATASTHFIALSADSVGPNERIFNHLGEGVNQRNSSFVSSQFNIYDGTNGLSVGSAETSSDYLITCRFVSNDATIHVNGVLQGTSNLIVQKEVTDFNLGTQGSFYFDGTIQEYIIYSSDQDASGNRPTIEKNINNAFSIYGGWEATVETWYDQSGNGNDASQSDTNAQPAIASGGVVIRENGKAAVQWDNVDDYLEFPITYPTSNIQIHSVYSTTDSLWIMLADGTKNIPIAQQGQSNTAIDGMSSYNFFKNGTSQSITTRGEVYTTYATGSQVLMTIDGTIINTSNATVKWGRLTASFTMNAKHQELIIYTSDQSDNRPLIEKSINSYYNIYAQDAAIQNVSTAQPTIYNGGLITENGKSAIYFVDTTYLVNSMSVVNQPLTILNVAAIKSYNAVNYLFDSDPTNTNRVFIGTNTSRNWRYFAGTSINTTSSAPLSQSLLTGIFSGTNSKLFVDNLLIDANNAGSNGISDLHIGSKNNGLISARANIQEFVVYSSDQDAAGNRTSIENNINSAFQIYSANFSSVLDSVPLAKAAYSIRRLTKNYIDPIITVTNGSTTKDFYADFWGNLDVDALTSFANGGTLSVTKWWDQSGEGVHLLTTADKPTLAISNNEVSVDTTNKFYEPLLDRYEGAAAAYSLRILKGDYTGPLVRVRRDDTNTEVDVYPDENLTISLNSPVLNVAEATTDVTANPLVTLATTLGEFVADAGSDPDGLGAPVSAFVVVWYDQANSNNASQDISTSQPKIYDSVDGVVTENGKPQIDFDGTNHFLSNNALTTSQPTTVSLVGTYDTGNDYFLDGSTSSNRQAVFVNSGEFSAYAGTTISSGVSATANMRVHIYTLFNSTSSEIYVNSVGVSSQDVGTGVLNGVDIGQRYTNSFRLDGQIQEIVFWNSNQTSAGNRTGIEDNINTYYSIYAGSVPEQQTVAVYNNAINTTVDLNATYTDLKEIIKYE